MRAGKGIVNRAELRANQLVIVILGVLAFAVDRWILALVIGMALASGTAWNLPAFQPLYRRILRPLRLVGTDVRGDDPGAHRFTQGLESILLLGASIAHGAGAPTIGWAMVWVVIVLAAVYAAGGPCFGCALYRRLFPGRDESSGTVPGNGAGNKPHKDNITPFRRTGP